MSRNGYGEGEFFGVFSSVVETHTEDETEHFLKLQRAKRQSNEHKIQDGKFQLRVTIFSELSNTGTSCSEVVQNLHS